MKNLKLTIVLICNLLFALSNVQAQAPEKINYQAVARNLAGAPLINQPISVKYEIRQGSPTGTLVFAETHSLTTSPFGLFTAEIGGGTPISGTFSSIAWGTSPFYLFVEVDGAAMGTTQLLSVPYALYAKESANGPAGLPGKNSLSLSTPYTGPACINGGTQVDAGLDDNNDGTLQPLEIDYTYIVCNGTDGTNGTNGTNGLPGTNGVDGVSIDSTINNNDGTFSIYYSNGTSFTTSDLTGPAGTSGTTYFAGNGISLSGDTITNLGDLDNNPTNELQLLSVSNDTIFLSNGGFAPLPSAGGFWTQLGGSIHNNNIGKVGIGTSTPIHQLSVASNDSVVASFLGTNPDVAAIVVGNFNPGAATGIVFFNGIDTTSYIFLNPATNTLAVRNNSVNGNIQISTDSVLVNQGLILVNQAQNSIYNQTDTIYNYSSSGEIINVNSGLFLTDSLYVLGSNATNTNWVLANDGFGQAKWTDPSTIVGSVGDNWGLQVVIHDTTLTGTGITGTPLSVNPNIIPTQTSQLTNNSGFITSPNDGDTSATNELQVLSFANDTLYLSNGNAIYLPPAAGDSWGSDSVITSGANISGSGTSANPLMVLDNDTSATNELQVLSFSNDTLYLSNGNAVYLPPAAGDSWGSDSVITSGANISGSGTSANPLMVFDNDTSATNELQTLSFVDPILTLSDGGGSVNLSTLSGTTYTAGTGINLTSDTITNIAPDQIVVITGGGTTSVTSAYPSFIVTTTDNDTSATNELITNFGLNGTSDSLVIKEAGNDWAVPLSSLSASANAWNLNGNTGTIVGTHFIGTGDAQPLMFKVNGNKAGFIDYDGSIANTGLGYQTLYLISTGTYNTAMGYTALRGNTTGNYNTAMGIGALYNNSTGSSNTAIGGSSLNGNLTGSFNTAIGDRSLQAVGNGSHNTAVGYLSLLSNSNAGQNVAIGSKSLYTQSFANGGTPYVTDNVAVGYQALYSNQPTGSGTDALRNIAVGSLVLYSNTTGLENTAIGHSALSSNNTGLRNTANGAWALYNNTTGSYNVALGYLAGVTFTGANANITGNNNTFIGYASGPGTSTQLSNATAIGANALVMTSNTVQLGAGADIDFDRALMPNGVPGTSGYLLSSQGAGVAPIWVDPSTISTSLWTDGGANTYLTSLTDNVGIGTNNPLSKLHIQGTSDPLEVVLENGGGAFKTGYSVKTGAGQSWFMGKELTPDFVIKDETVGQVRLQIATNGNVGIGTISPESMLHVALPNTANHKAFQLGHGNQPTLEWLFKVDEFSLFSIANENNGIEFTAMVIDANNGNVGIGTTTANSRLDVQNAANNVHTFSSIHTGTNAHAGYFQINNAANNLNAINATTNGAGAAINASNTYNGANAIRDGIYVTVTGAGGPITTNKAGYFSASGAANNYAAIFDQGNVGIGTGSPSAKLHLEGSLRLNNLSGTAPAIGSVLTSIDAAGNAEWAPPSGAANAWNLTGNAGTNASTNFIGTTDNVALNFRVNNTTAGKIDSAAANSFIGFLAGATTTGNNNTAIGYQSLLSNTSGTYNTAIGTNALRLNNTTNQNTAIGASALQNNTGSYNTATGYTALQNNTGTYNTATGHSALGSNTTGNNNTATGMSALFANTIGNDNTANGQYALSSNTQGNQNTAYGHRALFNNSTGNNNTATGQNALGGNQTGSGNTANGKEALFSNSSGDWNTATGAQALYSNTTGIYNTADGAGALMNNKIGGYNVAIGTGTLNSNDAGSEGVAIGYQSQYFVNNNATAWNNTNTSVGVLALRGSLTSSANTGLDNTAIGNRSMLNNTSGAGNTATGREALYNNSTGYNNTAIGLQSLYSNTTGFANIAIGMGALATNATGNNNTAIGAGADVSGVNLINATAIGAGASAGQSNSLILGSGANVGIGTSTPTAKLDVVNSTLNNTAKFTNTFTSGAQKVAVDGSATGGGAAANMGGSFAATGSTLSNYGIYANAYGNSGTKTGINASATGAGSNIAGQFSASGGSANYALIVPSGGGNVGIGTSTPTAGLDVNSTIVISGANTNELNRAQTGVANLVPIAYGSVSSGATIANAGTGNWTVTAGGAGQYTITVTGETFVGSSHIMSGTMNGTYGFISLIAFTNNILVQTTNTAGTNQNAAFSFVVYKP